METNNIPTAEELLVEMARYIPSLLCEVRDSRLNQIGL